jgi:hypothetical protein
MLLPGRGKLDTPRFSVTGSAPPTNTMGIVAVAA